MACDTPTLHGVSPSMAVGIGSSGVSNRSNWTLQLTLLFPLREEVYEVIVVCSTYWNEPISLLLVAGKVDNWLVVVGAQLENVWFPLSKDVQMN